MQAEKFVLRPLMVIGGGLCLYNGIVKIFENLKYTSTLVCFYLTLFSLVIIATGIATEYIENCLGPMCPFLGKPLSKGVFLILIASLCFGGEMGYIGTYSGIALLTAGCCYIAIQLTQPPPEEFRTEKVFFENPTYEPPQFTVK